jgi:hypothetical protein
VKVAAIEATANTDALAAYITGADYPTWPASPDQPAPLPSDPDGLQRIVNDGSSVDQVFG